MTDIQNTRQARRAQERRRKRIEDAFAEMSLAWAQMIKEGFAREAYDEMGVMLSLVQENRMHMRKDFGFDVPGREGQ